MAFKDAIKSEKASFSAFECLTKRNSLEFGIDLYRNLMIISNGIVDEQRRKSTTIDTIFLVGFSRSIICAMCCVQKMFLSSFFHFRSSFFSLYFAHALVLLVFLRSKMPWLESIMSFSSSLNIYFHEEVSHTPWPNFEHVRHKIATRRCS